MSAVDEFKRHAEQLRASTGLTVEVVEEGARLFALIRKAPLPPGLFEVDATDVLLIADQQYPLSAMDMFWTEVEVVKPGGGIPQGAEQIEQYLGRSWRRFSWHRNNVWNPAGNPLLDHHSFVESRWAAEPRA